MLEAVLEVLVQLHDFSNVYLRRQGIYRMAFELSLVSKSPDEDRFLFKPRGLATSPLFLPPDASQPPEMSKSVHLTHASQFSGHVWTSSSFWVRYSDEVVLLNDTALLSIDVPLDRVDILSRSLQVQVRLLFSDSCPPQFKIGNTKQAESYPMTEVACLCLLLESPFIGARLTRKLTFSSPYSSISTITVSTCLTRISSSWRSCLLVPSADEAVDRTQHYMQVSPPKSGRATVDDVYDALSDPPINISKHEAVYIHCLRQALGAYCSLVEFFYDEFLGMFPVAYEDDIRKMLGSLGPSMPGQSLPLGNTTLVFDSKATIARWSMDSAEGPSFSVEWCNLDWEASRCVEPLHLSMPSLPSDLDKLLTRMKVDLDAVFVGVQAVWHTVQLLSSMFPNLVREEGLLKSEVADLVKWELCVVDDDVHLVCDKAISLRKSTPSSLPKPVPSRFDNKDICWPHIFLERSSSIPNPIHGIQRTNCDASVHLVVLVHGLDGRGADLQHFRDALREVNEDVLTWSSTWNELHTSGSIEESGRRLAEEITKFVQSTCPGSSLGQLSLICFSLGGLIGRSAVEYLPALQPKMHAFISLACPHLGLVKTSSAIFDAGLWFVKRVTKSKALLELAMTDSRNPRDTYLYRLAKNNALSHFSYVVLLSAHDDQYAPHASSKVHLDMGQLDDSAARREMAKNVLRGVDPLRLTRLTVSFKVEERTMDTFIGRHAHMQVLDSRDFSRCLLRLYADLFA